MGYRKDGTTTKTQISGRAVNVIKQREGKGLPVKWMRKMVAGGRDRRKDINKYKAIGEIRLKA